MQINCFGLKSSLKGFWANCNESCGWLQLPDSIQFAQNPFKLDFNPKQLVCKYPKSYFRVIPLFPWIMKVYNILYNYIYKYIHIMYIYIWLYIYVYLPTKPLGPSWVLDLFILGGPQRRNDTSMGSPSSCFGTSWRCFHGILHFLSGWWFCTVNNG